MRLTDEENSAESGIDVVASPPGKKLQNVLLLSGGEKALTALALLVGIFQYQPSPFCILDRSALTPASSSASSAGSQSSGSSSGSSSPSISTSPQWSSVQPGPPLALRPISSSEVERDQRAGEGVDLVRGERRAVGEVRLLLREQPLQSEHQREVPPPGERRLAPAGVDLLHRGVQRRARGPCPRSAGAASSP